jgi:hypothetical protein
MDNGDTLEARIAAYANTAAHNDALFAEFAGLTDTVPCLEQHRDWVESNRWGFGERAFHYAWWLLLADLGRRFGTVNALEIGVHSGQLVSLWGVVGRALEIDTHITAMSPFEGNIKPQPKWMKSLRKRLDPVYRRQKAVGNLHPHDDYLGRTRHIFAAFDLDFAEVRVIRGYSQDPAVANQVAGETFELLCIDGDHSLDAVRSDIAIYAPMVPSGGYLVLDDAGFDVEGGSFWKGFETVSEAARDIPALGFDNVLNIAHARVFRRQQAMTI